MADDFDEVDYGDDVVSLPSDDERLDGFIEFERDSQNRAAQDEGLLAAVDAELISTETGVEGTRLYVEEKAEISDKDKVGISAGYAGVQVQKDVDMELAERGPSGAILDHGPSTTLPPIASTEAVPRRDRPADADSPPLERTASTRAGHQSLPPKPLETHVARLGPEKLTEWQPMVAESDYGAVRGQVPEPQTANSVPKLPPDWETRTSKSRGTTYYYNIKTQESAWEFPGPSSSSSSAGADTQPPSTAPEPAVARKGYDHYSPPRNGRVPAEPPRDPPVLSTEPGRPPPRRTSTDHYSPPRSSVLPPLRRGRSPPPRRMLSPPPARGREPPRERSPLGPRPRSRSPPGRMPRGFVHPPQRRSSPPPQPIHSGPEPPLTRSANKRPRSPSPVALRVARDIPQPSQKRPRASSPDRRVPLGQGVSYSSNSNGMQSGARPPVPAADARYEQRDVRGRSPPIRHVNEPPRPPATTRPDASHRSRPPSPLGVSRYQQEPRAGSPSAIDRTAPISGPHSSGTFEDRQEPIRGRRVWGGADSKSGPPTDHRVPAPPVAAQDSIHPRAGVPRWSRPDAARPNEAGRFDDRQRPEAPGDQRREPLPHPRSRSPLDQRRLRSPRARYDDRALPNHAIDSRERPQDFSRREPERARQLHTPPSQPPLVEYPSQARYSRSTDYAPMDVDNLVRGEARPAYDRTDDRLALQGDKRYPERSEAMARRPGPVTQASTYRPVYDDDAKKPGAEPQQRRDDRPQGRPPYLVRRLSIASMNKFERLSRSNIAEVILTSLHLKTLLPETGMMYAFKLAFIHFTNPSF
ncbi:hypothetical protein CALCODRAFT_463744 [Calocera cornea HHB12733]|uniref:WW domain-containing protein n=1 Tax=Calocera cornea HHB12733 TaxID=1353952 RepID=A0A165JBU9_9BASI|nr:hypothetical protein CALCODRAFT_463744 [Calocera cornea HHB12733]